MPFPIDSAPLLQALQQRRYDEPTPVQAAVLGGDRDGRDLLVSARTGSGKTLAYGLAFAADLLGGREHLEPAAAPLALVVAPTRELALQVQRELTWLYHFAGGRVVACVGGMDPRREGRQLADGAHVVVGTPGRLRDHLERGRLDLAGLRVVVLDEADEMLDLGFREDLEFILRATPPERRTLLFSATLPDPIVALARGFQREAVRVDVGAGEGGHADIAYRALRVGPREVPLAVVNVLRFHEVPTALVFCNTREAVRHLQAGLLERGFSVVALSGELGQGERNQALQALRDGRARVCVATDVAARGIDLPGLDLVIHADVPHDAEALQHRSGRTGRAGRKGISVLLVPAARRRKVERLLGAAGVVAAWSGPPTAEEIRALDRDRLVEGELLREEPDEDDLDLARAVMAAHPPERIAAALVRSYRARLPAAEEVADPGFAPPRREARARGDARAPGPADAGFDRGVWFRLSVGRGAGADPKWLLPMLCQRGGITRGDVGPIRIFERETKVLISDRAAPDFARAVRGSEAQGVRIEPLVGLPAGSQAGPSAGPPAGSSRPARHAARDPGPRNAKARGRRAGDRTTSA